MANYDLSKEQTVLGSLLSDPVKAREIVPKLTRVFGERGKNAFYYENNRAIFEAVLELYNKGDPIEIPAIYSYLKKSKRNIPKSYLAELVSHDLTPVTTEYYARDLNDLAARREIERSASEILNKIKDGSGTEEIIEGTVEKFTILRRSQKEEVKAVTAKELIETPLPENQYLVGRGLVPKHGYTMLVGKAKEGKTMLSLHIALCLATRTPFLMSKGEGMGLFPVPEAKRTLFLLRENVDETIQTFLRKQIGGLEKRLDRGIKESLGLINFFRPKTTYLDLRGEGLRELRNLLDDYNPDLVVIDPLSRFLVSDMNSMQTAIKVANMIDGLGEEYGCAFLLVHHFRKLGEGDVEAADVFQRITGSSGWRNSYVSCLALERRHKGRSSHIKRLSFEFRTHEPIDPVTIERDPEALLFEQITEDEAFEGRSTVEGLVEIIKKEFKEGVRYGLIAEVASERFGVTKRRITELLKKGLEEGLIGKEKGREGKYYILSQDKLFE